MSVAPSARPRVAFKNILYATDFSQASRNALPCTAALARHYQSHVYVLNVIEDMPLAAVPMDSAPPNIERDREWAQNQLQGILQAPELQALDAECVLKFGDLSTAVCHFSEEHKVDLIVLGTHGRGALSRLFLGSAAEEIFRCASCPVVTVGPHAKPSLGIDSVYKTIVFATDFSPASLHALEYAYALTDEHSAELVMVHVVIPKALPLDVTDHLVTESARKLQLLIPEDRPFAHPPVRITVAGDPVDHILDISSRMRADLIVMGVHKHTAVSSHWPFEVAGRVMAGACCPVLSVRS